MKELTTMFLSVETLLHKTNTLSPIAPTCSTIALWWIRPGYQFNNITLQFSSPPQAWIWACIYRAQWIGIVERIVGEVAIRSYQEGSQLQPTHIDRDNVGHEAYVLEALRILFFSFLPRVPLLFPYDRAMKGKNRSKRKARTRWHCFSIIGLRRW